MSFAVLLLFAFALPPAAKTLLVIVAVFTILQAAKLSPWLDAYVVTGRKAVALNVGLTICGILVTVPASQLYSINTIVLVVTSVLGSAGIHGTKQAFSKPQMAATIPPDPTVKNVPAHVTPDDPAARPVGTKNS